VRIAVVGSGISGLATTWLLRDRHEVTLFEKEDWVGGHTHTVDVEYEGDRQAVDTGFIIYNETTYPLFSELLRRLDVATQPTDMSFSVACDRSGLEWASRNVRTVLAQPLNLLRPSFRGMIRDILRFNREAPELLAMEGEKVSLADYLEGSRYSSAFRDHYLVPLGAAIWSADPKGFLDFPAATFVRFFQNHGLLQRRSPVRWRVVKGGSRSYVEALAAQLPGRVFQRTPVARIRRHAQGVEVETLSGGRFAFDRVVLATHSDQALGLLAEPSEAERRILGAIRYQPNEVVLHTDASLLPRRRRARASWNVRIPDRDQGSVAISYDMNRLQGLSSPHTYLVTLNASERIDPKRVLGRWTCDHPVFDGPAMAAQRLRDAIDGHHHTHFCGAYWGYGFHEDGMRSAVQVARSLGVEF
jgi:predicted NAD/FAD-binding protein